MYIENVKLFSKHTKLRFLSNRNTDFLNAFRATGECRRQVKNVPNLVKYYFKIVEFHDHIWNHHEKCIQISTNMPSIG